MSLDSSGLAKFNTALISAASHLFGGLIMEMAGIGRQKMLPGAPVENTNSRRKSVDPKNCMPCKERERERESVS